ncbi:uncharacterized protein V6R79_013652 [Siganus canaliculatus]
MDEAENSWDPNSIRALMRRVRNRILLFVLPISQIIIGALYHNECPKQRMIPIFLEVLGIYSLPLVVNVIFPSLIREPMRIYVMSINFLFVLGWFIAGNVWTFQIFQPNYDETTTDVDPYCNQILYMSSVVFIGLNYGLMLIIIMFSCCYWCQRRHDDEEQRSPLLSRIL